jgi:hypothetical protein
MYIGKESKGMNQKGHSTPKVERPWKDRNKNSARRSTTITYKRETSGKRKDEKIRPT